MNVIQRNVITFVLVVAIFNIGFAQKNEKFYNYKWQECKPNMARFYSSVTKTDTGFLRKDYFIKEKSLQMSGLFSDEACKVKNGFFTYCHNNGAIYSYGKYINNQKEGLWKSYYDNGFKKDSMVFHSGKLYGIGLTWHSNGCLEDSFNLKEDGSGVYVSWFDNGKLSSAGKYSADIKQTGTWKYYHKNGKVSSNEIYFNSKLIDRRYFDENGEMLNDTTNRDRTAQFGAGMDSWIKYINEHISFPEGCKIINSDSAIVVVSFIVNEEGSVEDVNVSTSFEKVFDEEVINTIIKSPRWLPAINHNRKIPMAFELPVIFKNF